MNNTKFSWGILIPLGLMGDLPKRTMSLGVNYKPSKNMTDDQLNAEIERNNRLFIQKFLAPALPPLKVFLGWTPMNEFISKCKPFVPNKSSDTYTDLRPHQIEIMQSIMSHLCHNRLINGFSYGKDENSK